MRSALPLIAAMALATLALAAPVPQGPGGGIIGFELPPGSVGFGKEKRQLNSVQQFGEIFAKRQDESINGQEIPNPIAAAAAVFGLAKKEEKRQDWPINGQEIPPSDNGGLLGYGKEKRQDEPINGQEIPNPIAAAAALFGLAKEKRQLNSVQHFGEIFAKEKRQYEPIDAQEIPDEIAQQGDGAILVGLDQGSDAGAILLGLGK
ncbi:hypothetical protein G7Y89_g10493 [Cudoniella acicularis]|uniref:Uncharacterized protein n=1 Tax=Cudoniella acicularis TaxID=354080 RepID=A0A8H4REZ2_9HELO|nr:hypothetical protein G7Y89_g10493 [Cudoniella acicularis]